MRGSYQWAMLRLAILAVFVVPAALLQAPVPGQAHASSWLAAVDIAEPVLVLHQGGEHVVLTVDDAAAVKQSAITAVQAQQEALRALHKELAREIVRVRLQRDRNESALSKS